jgi:uncharacterized sulfatase
MKQTVFERATRTPMMMAAPGVTANGQVSHRVIELLDIYPTLAAVAGVKAPAGLPGRSLQPLLENPKAAWDHAAVSQVRRPITVGPGARRGPAANLTGPDADGAEAYRTNPVLDDGYTIRTELYRYISWNDGKAGEELFDELNDPGETRNLAAQPFYAKVLADLRSRLTAVRNAPTQ